MTCWQILFEEFDPADEGRREALCTLGNGYFATRGATAEAHADDVHYPGTYLAGCYNRLTSTVAGRKVEDESLVNMPNWLWLTFRIDGGTWFTLTEVDLLDYQQELDIERGILLRRLRFRDNAGRTTCLAQRRFVHMGSPHLAGLETALVPEDYSGSLTVRAGIDGQVRNCGVTRYHAFNSQHLTDYDTFEADTHSCGRPAPGRPVGAMQGESRVAGGAASDTVVLHAQTSHSCIVIAEASRTRVLLNGKPADTHRSLIQQEAAIAHDLTIDVHPGVEARVEKIAAVYTSRDTAIADPVGAAAEHAARAGCFDDLLRSHVLAWDQLWRKFHCGLRASPAAQQAVCLHLFHLLQTVSPHTADLDVGIPARGLHGEAYRGHVFWDELFVLPTITLRMPEVTRSLLLYRYRRLPQARLAARNAGYAGALFPWQSASNGREESQHLHLNPRSGRWIPDHSHLQRHIGIAIAYNVWHYHQATGDDEFLASHGAELILEITRLFSALASYDRSRDRYVIRGVVGPDEYHTGYPGRDRPGVDNNAYTNIMTAWLCRTALRVLAELPAERRHELTETLDLRHREIDRWKRLAQRMFVPYQHGIISQFEGYAQLAEFDWDGYRARYGDIQRLDRILEAEGDDPNRYQASKQADVLMLFYLLSAEELQEVLTGLGYPMPSIPDTIDYYLKRTCHGSTLSAVVHSWVLARAHRHRAMEFFDHALASDLHDTQHGTTAEGIHLAAMVGSVDLLQRCFAGIEARNDTLWLNPFWPTELGTLELSLHYRGQPITARVTGRSVTVHTAPDHRHPPIKVQCGPHSELLGPGETARFSLGREVSP